MGLLILLFVFAVFYLGSLLISAIPFSFPKRKLNPEKLTVLYGGPGSGKSTWLAYECVKAIKSGIPVYSNVPIKGAFQLEESDIGKWKIPYNSLVIFDEVGSVYNNRDFKSHFQGTKKKNSDGSYEVTPSQSLMWWKQHRHEGCECIIASQGFDDMDKKLQTLGSHYYIVRKIPIKGFPIILTREIKKRPDIDEQTHQPVDGFYFKPFGFRFIFGRFLWSYYDSFNKMPLPDKEWSRFGI